MMRLVRIRKLTAITQVHSYIKEHYKPGDLVNARQLHQLLPWLTFSSVSAALWKLGKEEILLVDTNPGKFGNIYMVDENYMITRGKEDREAPEPGKPRNCKRKLKETTNAKIKKNHA